MPGAQRHWLRGGSKVTDVGNNGFQQLNLYKQTSEERYGGEAWWHTPLTPAHSRHRQVDPWEFKASMFYKASSRPVRVM